MASHPTEERSTTTSMWPLGTAAPWLLVSPPGSADCEVEGACGIPRGGVKRHRNPGRAAVALHRGSPAA